MSEKPAKLDVEHYPAHARNDALTRNENIDADKPLCARCSGTGNELLSMYRACQACGGTGVSRGNEHNTFDD